MYKDEEQGCIFIDTAAAQVYSREQKTDLGSVAAFGEEKVTRKKASKGGLALLAFSYGGTNRKE